VERGIAYCTNKLSCTDSVEYPADDDSILFSEFLFVLCQDGVVTYVNNGTVPNTGS